MSLVASGLAYVELAIQGREHFVVGWYLLLCLVLGVRWRQLHRVGLHYLWAVYVVIFSLGVADRPWYGAIVALLLVGAALRIKLAWRPS